MEMVTLETELSDAEVSEFNELCAQRGVCPAQKIGEMIHGFILAEGVKHRILEAVA